MENEHLNNACDKRTSELVPIFFDFQNRVKKAKQDDMSRSGIRVFFEAFAFVAIVVIVSVLAFAGSK